MDTANKDQAVGPGSGERKSTKQRMEARRIQLRGTLWPNVPEEMLWNRKRNDGFTTIPRTMPIIQLIVDSLSKGTPLSGVYFSLWGRINDQGFVTIDNPRELAFESGFAAQRAEATWRNRMNQLKELGFIRCEPGISGEFHNVLVLNPHLVIRDLHKMGRISRDLFNTLYVRAQKVGADDFVGE